MYRSIFLALVLIITAFPCLSLSGDNSSEQAEKPNILFIAVDDLNDWVGPLGGLPLAKTPNIDKLAKQGLTFTNAHCPAPACAPSRLAIMTGVQPSKSDVMQNVWFDGPGWRKIPVLENIETMDQFFKNRG